MDPSDISQAFTNWIPAGLFDQIIDYVGYTLVAIVILAFFAIIYYIIVYKYKVTYPVLHYNDKEGKSAAIIKYKHDRACDKKTRNGVKKQHLLFKRITIEPFRDRDIHPGNIVNLLKINDDGTYIPMPNIILGNPVNEFETLSPEERYWAVLQLQENVKTFQSDDAQRRIMLLTIGTVILCLVAAVIAVWLSVKAPQSVASSFDSFGQQFMSATQSLGGTPPG